MSKKTDYQFCEECNIYFHKETYTEEDMFDEKTLRCPVCGGVIDIEEAKNEKEKE